MLPFSCIDPYAEGVDSSSSEFSDIPSSWKRAKTKSLFALYLGSLIALKSMP